MKSLFYPYKFDKHKYKNTFLINSSDSADYSTNKPVQKIIYVFWTGENEMSENRKRCLESIKSMAGVEVKLITSENLDSYVIKEHPLHPAYKYLSYVHRADYLRCYFMNFYGGGYIDIKQISNSWEKSFSRLNASTKYLIGYPEINYEHIARYGQKNENLKYDLYVYWSLLVGNSGYICRPHTKFTEEWLAEIEKRLDFYFPLLQKCPSHSNPYLNDGTEYPIQWTEICGSVFHPLCLKYNTKILRDNTLKPIIKDYR
jgi:hypothetical protein